MPSWDSFRAKYPSEETQRARFEDLARSLFCRRFNIKYGIFQNNIASKYRTTFISMQSQAVALGGLLYYSFSSLLSIKLSLNTIISLALIITFIANFYSCKGLRKEKVV